MEPPRSSGIGTQAFKKLKGLFEGRKKPVDGGVREVKGEEEPVADEEEEYLMNIRKRIRLSTVRSLPSQRAMNSISVPANHPILCTL